MQSAELRYIRSLNLIIRGADTLTLHFAFCILHFPDTGEGIKNTHPLTKQGWDTNVFHGSTLVTAIRPSLIDALTGAPGGAFLPHGSEVVSFPAGLQMPCTKMASSLRIFPEKHVFVTAFLYGKFSTIFSESHSPGGEKPFPAEENGEILVSAVT